MERTFKRYVVSAMAVLCPLAVQAGMGARTLVSSCSYAIKGAQGLSSMRVLRGENGTHVAEFDQMRSRQRHHMSLPQVTLESLDHRALRKDDSWIPLAASNVKLDPGKVYSIRRFVTSQDNGDGMGSSLVEFLDQSRHRLAAVFQYGWTVYPCLPERSRPRL